MNKKLKYILISSIVFSIFFIPNNTKSSSKHKLISVMNHISTNSINNSSISNNSNESYKYKLKLNGRMPNAEVDSTFTVLTNDKNLTFETLVKSITSYNSEDSLDIQILSD